MESKNELKKLWLKEVREFIESTIINSDKMGMDKGKEYYINHESLYNCLKTAKLRFELADAKPLTENELIEFLYFEFYQIHLRAIIEHFKQCESIFDAINDANSLESLREVKSNFLLLGSKIIALNEYKDQVKIYQSKLN